MKVLAPIVALVILASCSGSQQKAAFDNTVVAGTVKAKIIAVDADATTAVKVTAANGIVTLTGQARNDAEKARYGDAARSVDGVTSVHNDVVINPHLKGLREQARDAALTARVAAAIGGQAGINVFKLRISTHEGVVSLDGRVRSASIERTVVETARGVSGVKRVVAHLTVGT